MPLLICYPALRSALHDDVLQAHDHVPVPANDRALASQDSHLSGSQGRQNALVMQRYPMALGHRSGDPALPWLPVSPAAQDSRLVGSKMPLLVDPLLPAGHTTYESYPDSRKSRSRHAQGLGQSTPAPTPRESFPGPRLSGFPRFRLLPLPPRECTASTGLEMDQDSRRISACRSGNRCCVKADLATVVLQGPPSLDLGS